MGVYRTVASPGICFFIHLAAMVPLPLLVDYFNVPLHKINRPQQPQEKKIQKLKANCIPELYTIRRTPCQTGEEFR